MRQESQKLKVQLCWQLEMGNDDLERNERTVVTITHLSLFFNRIFDGC